MQKFEKIKTIDSYELSLTKFIPGVNPKSVILIASATGVKRRYYNDFAEYFSELGHVVITFDYRGIGESRPKSLKGFNACMHEWGEKDLSTIIQNVKKEYSQCKLNFIGHSVGGQMIGLTSNNREVDNIILVGAQSGFWKHWDFKGKLWLFSYWYFLIPVFSYAFGYFPAKMLKLHEDLPKGVALEWAKWGRAKEYLFNYIDSGKNYSNITAPIYAFSFEDDNYATKKSVAWLLGKYKNAKVTHRHIFPKELGVDAVGHFGFFRKKMKTALWGKVEAILEEKVYVE